MSHESDRYEVTLVCACGATMACERWHQNDPYSNAPYVCADCVVKRQGR